MLRDQQHNLSSLVQKGALDSQIFPQILLCSQMQHIIFLACLGGTHHDVECTKFFPKVTYQTFYHILWSEVHSWFFYNPGRTLYLSRIFFWDISAFLMPEFCCLASSDFHLETAKEVHNDHLSSKLLSSEFTEIFSLPLIPICNS